MSQTSEATTAETGIDEFTVLKGVKDRGSFFGLHPVTGTQFGLCKLSLSFLC